MKLKLLILTTLISAKIDQNSESNEMKFETKNSDIIRIFLLFFVMLLININAASSKERAMNCVLKEPIYKFVDRLILTDKVLEKKDGEWRSFCTGMNEELSILDGSAKCSQLKQIYFAREISSTEHAEFSEACDQDKLYNHTTYIHRPFIWKNWDINLDICRFFNLLESDAFETKETPWNTFYHNGKKWRSSNPKYFREKKELTKKKEWLLSTRFHIVETTEFSYYDVILLNFETKQKKYSKELSRITIPQNVRLVRPSDGTGQGTIRDIAGDPWDIINFSETSTFDCEEVELY